MSVTSVRLQPEVEVSLEAIALKLNRSKGWLINQALKEYISREELAARRWQDTLSALESVSKGRVVSESSVHTWLESWGSEGEQAPPKPGQ